MRKKIKDMVLTALLSIFVLLGATFPIWGTLLVIWIVLKMIKSMFF